MRLLSRSCLVALTLFVTACGDDASSSDNPANAAGKPFGSNYRVQLADGELQGDSILESEYILLMFILKIVLSGFPQLFKAPVGNKPPPLLLRDCFPTRLLTAFPHQT